MPDEEAMRMNRRILVTLYSLLIIVFTHVALTSF